MLPPDCPWCGATYRGFRAAGQPTFTDAIHDAIQRSLQRKAEGDYVFQGRRGTALMVMREYKLGAWGEHLHWCGLQWEAENVASERD
jgi:hypothetical protein